LTLHLELTDLAVAGEYSVVAGESEQKMQCL
jgi:hypothetical protein